MGCPKSENLFEFVSIPSELPPLSRLRLGLHVWVCSGCRERARSIRETWQNYLVPEPDVTQSIIRVYSRLKHDETLILKGWKLGESHPSGAFHWVFPGAVALGALILTVWTLIPTSQSSVPSAPSNDRGPLAQIRYEDKNRVQVRYVRPELIQSIDFETASSP